MDAGQENVPLVSQEGVQGTNLKELKYVCVNYCQTHNPSLSAAFFDVLCIDSNHFSPYWSLELQRKRERSSGLKTCAFKRNEMKFLPETFLYFQHLGSFGSLHMWREGWIGLCFPYTRRCVFALEQGHKRVKELDKSPERVSETKSTN